MASRSSFGRALALVAGLALAGCQLVTTRPADDAPEAVAPGGVALLLDGPAFQATGARDAVVALVGERTGRPVRVLAREPTAGGVLQPIARRTARERGSYEWHEPACVKRARPLLPAIATGADAVYRVRLSATTTGRPATDADRDALDDPLGRVLAAVGLGRANRVVETRLDGSVERTTFAGTPSTSRQAVHWKGARLAEDDEPSPLDVRAATTAALDAMPPALAPRFDALGRSLVANGCPFLAYAVGATLVRDPETQHKLEGAALAAMRRGKQAAVKVEETADASDASEPVASTPEPAAPIPTVETGQAYTCSALCSLHMVELCNGDRTLWSQNGARWESTRCGMRRSEPFLTECYRMQWLSGTYERACVRPCEEAAEGRLRLQSMLRRAGCLRAGS